MQTSQLAGTAVLIVDGEGPMIGVRSVDDEGNRRDGPWFVATLAELKERLARGPSS